MTALAWLFIASLIAALAWVGVAVLVWWRQADRVFVPVRKLYGTPADIGLSFRDIGFQAEDGPRLHGWLVEGGDRGALLVLHGNTGNISTRLQSLRLWARLGVDVFVIDYRGYGKSEGTPDEAGLYRDAMAAWRWLTSTGGYAPERIVVLGRSLGGPVAAWLAARVAPAALVLEATFTSLPELARETFRLLPARRMCRFRFGTLDHVASGRCPVLVVHSREDELVKFEHARRLVAAAPGRGELLALTGLHHTLAAAAPEAYRAGLEAFIARHLP